MTAGFPLWAFLWMTAWAALGTAWALWLGRRSWPGQTDHR